MAEVAATAAAMMKERIFSNGIRWVSSENGEGTVEDDGEVSKRFLLEVDF